MSALKRFQNRKSIRINKPLRQKNINELKVSKEFEDLLNKSPNYKDISKDINDSLNKHMDVSVSEYEIKEYLSILEQQYYSNKIDSLLDEIKRTSLQAIITKFGISGQILNRTGGNVDTIHNSREGIYATEEERLKYNSRDSYNSHKYHSDRIYKEKNKLYKFKRENGLGEDYITNQKVKSNDK